MSEKGLGTMDGHSISLIMYSAICGLYLIIEVVRGLPRHKDEKYIYWYDTVTGVKRWHVQRG